MCIVPKSLTKKWLSDCAKYGNVCNVGFSIYIIFSHLNTQCVFGFYRKCEELGGFSDVGEKPFP